MTAKQIVIVLVALAVVFFLLRFIARATQSRIGMPVHREEFLARLRTLISNGGHLDRLRFWPEIPEKKTKGVDVLRWKSGEKSKIILVLHQKGLGPKAGEVMSALEEGKFRFELKKDPDPRWGRHDAMLLECDDDAWLATEALEYLFFEIYSVPADATFKYVKWEKDVYVWH